MTLSDPGPIPDCQAVWEFDLEFFAYCSLPEHGPTGHRATVDGNGGVPAIIVWDDRRPAVCDATVDCQSDSGHTLCCPATSRRPMPDPAIEEPT